MKVGGDGYSKGYSFKFPSPLGVIGMKVETETCKAAQQLILFPSPLGVIGMKVFGGSYRIATVESSFRPR